MRRCVMGKYRWWVFGEFGDQFTNLKAAKACAKFCSTTPEYDYQASVFRIEDGCYYIDYEHGKCVRDGWTIKKD